MGWGGAIWDTEYTAERIRGMIDNGDTDGPTNHYGEPLDLGETIIHKDPLAKIHDCSWIDELYAPHNKDDGCWKYISKTEDPKAYVEPVMCKAGDILECFCNEGDWDNQAFAYYRLSADAHIRFGSARTGTTDRQIPMGSATYCSKATPCRVYVKVPYGAKSGALRVQVRKRVGSYLGDLYSNKGGMTSQGGVTTAGTKFADSFVIPILVANESGPIGIEAFQCGMTNVDRDAYSGDQLENMVNPWGASTNNGSTSAIGMNVLPNNIGRVKSWTSAGSYWPIGFTAQQVHYICTQAKEITVHVSMGTQKNNAAANFFKGVMMSNLTSAMVLAPIGGGIGAGAFVMAASIWGMMLSNELAKGAGGGSVVLKMHRKDTVRHQAGFQGVLAGKEDITQADVESTSPIFVKVVKDKSGTINSFMMFDFSKMRYVPQNPLHMSISSVSRSARALSCDGDVVTNKFSAGGILNYADPVNQVAPYNPDDPTQIDAQKEQPNPDTGNPGWVGPYTLDWLDNGNGAAGRLGVPATSNFEVTGVIINSSSDDGAYNNYAPGRSSECKANDSDGYWITGSARVEDLKAQEGIQLSNSPLSEGEGGDVGKQVVIDEDGVSYTGTVTDYDYGSKKHTIELTNGDSFEYPLQEAGYPYTVHSPQNAWVEGAEWRYAWDAVERGEAHNHWWGAMTPMNHPPKQRNVLADEGFYHKVAGGSRAGAFKSPWEEYQAFDYYRSEGLGNAGGLYFSYFYASTISMGLRDPIVRTTQYTEDFKYAGAGAKDWGHDARYCMDNSNALGWGGYFWGEKGEPSYWLAGKNLENRSIQELNSTGQRSLKITPYDRGIGDNVSKWFSEKDIDKHRRGQNFFQRIGRMWAGGSGEDTPPGRIDAGKSFGGWPENFLDAMGSYERQAGPACKMESTHPDPVVYWEKWKQNYKMGATDGNTPIKERYEDQVSICENIENIRQQGGGGEVWLNQDDAPKLRGASELSGTDRRKCEEAFGKGMDPSPVQPWEKGHGTVETVTTRPITAAEVKSHLDANAGRCKEYCAGENAIGGSGHDKHDCKDGVDNDDKYWGPRGGPEPSVCAGQGGELHKKWSGPFQGDDGLSDCMENNQPCLPVPTAGGTMDKVKICFGSKCYEIDCSAGASGCVKVDQGFESGEPCPACVMGEYMMDKPGEDWKWTDKELQDCGWTAGPTTDFKNAGWFDFDTGGSVWKVRTNHLPKKMEPDYGSDDPNYSTFQASVTECACNKCGINDGDHETPWMRKTEKAPGSVTREHDMRGHGFEYWDSGAIPVYMKNELTAMDFFLGQSKRHDSKRNAAKFYLTEKIDNIVCVGKKVGSNIDPIAASPAYQWEPGEIMVIRIHPNTTGTGTPNRSVAVKNFDGQDATGRISRNFTGLKPDPAGWSQKEIDLYGKGSPITTTIEHERLKLVGTNKGEPLGSTETYFGSLAPGDILMKCHKDFTVKQNSNHGMIDIEHKDTDTAQKQADARMHNTQLLGGKVDSNITKWGTKDDPDDGKLGTTYDGLFKTYKLCKHVGGPLDNYGGKGGGHNAVLSMARGSIIGKIGVWWASRKNASSSFIQGIRYDDASNLPDVGRMPVQFSMLPGTRTKHEMVDDGQGGMKEGGNTAGGGMTKWNYAFSFGKNGYPLPYVNGNMLEGQGSLSFDEIHIKIPTLGQQGPVPKITAEYVWIYFEEEPGVETRKSNWGNNSSQVRSATGSTGIQTTFPLWPITIFNSDKINITEHVDTIKASESTEPPIFIEMKCPAKWDLGDKVSITVEVQGAANVLNAEGAVIAQAYQWQGSEDGEVWSNLTDGWFEGKQGKTLTIDMSKPPVSFRANGNVIPNKNPNFRYRCKCSNSQGMRISDESLLRDGLAGDGVCNLSGKDDSVTDPAGEATMSADVNNLTFKVENGVVTKVNGADMVQITVKLDMGKAEELRWSTPMIIIPAASDNMTVQQDGADRCGNCNVSWEEVTFEDDKTKGYKITVKSGTQGAPTLTREDIESASYLLISWGVKDQDLIDIRIPWSVG